jgi:hypothetical protein
MPTGHDRLGGAVGLDDVADEDADQERDPDAALGHREPERERLGHPDDEDPDRDRLPAPRLRGFLGMDIACPPPSRGPSAAWISCSRRG